MNTKSFAYIFAGILAIASCSYANSHSTQDEQATRTGFFLAPAVGVLTNSGTGYKTSPELTLSFGYSFSPYFSIKAGSILFAARSEDSAQSTKFSTYTRADVVFSLPTKTLFTPYVLLGVGKLSMAHTEFASNIGVGIAYTLSQNFALTANYRNIIPAKTSGTMNLFDIGFVHYF